MRSIATSVRITADANLKVAAIAERIRASKAQVIEMAVSALEERLFWQDVQDAYAALSEDPLRLAQYRREIAAWDGTLSDGLIPADSAEDKQ
jgi:hypothetical protein